MFEVDTITVKPHSDEVEIEFLTLGSGQTEVTVSLEDDPDGLRIMTALENWARRQIRDISR